MRKIAIGIIVLGLIAVYLWNFQYKPVSSIRVEDNQIQKNISEDLEKCTCGTCELDIFKCACPRAKKQREAFEKKQIERK